VLTNTPSRQFSLKNHSHGLGGNYSSGGWDMQGPMSSVPVQMGTLDPLEALLGPFPCVRLRGLPFDATLENVCILMQGLVILDVLIVTESYGHGTGEAFVVFANPMDFTMALQR
jgi:heterogeneous nuclear ribonucleoprotein F/H